MLLARCGGKTEVSADLLPPGVEISDSYYLGWVDQVASKNTTENLGLMSHSTLINSVAFGNMVGFGFVFITIVLLVSAAFGERAPVRVRKLTFDRFEDKAAIPTDPFTNLIQPQD